LLEAAPVATALRRGEAVLPLHEEAGLGRAAVLPQRRAGGSPAAVPLAPVAPCLG